MKTRIITAILGMLFALLVPVAVTVATASPAQAVAYNCGAWNVGSSNQYLARRCISGPGKSFDFSVKACGPVGCRYFTGKSPSGEEWGGYPCTMVLNLRGSSYYLTTDRVMYETPVAYFC